MKQVIIVFVTWVIGLLQVQGQQVGKPVPAFRLEDSEGHFINLADFEGKVVVIDIWYTGCSSCAYFYQHVLSGIENEFLSKNEVVFISVSTDKDRKCWLKSVAGGNYTSSKLINVYTGGKGFQHALLTFYDVERFPYLLIIDKKGNLHAAIDTVNHYSTEQITQLIKDVH
ncbi:Thioredoxin-like [bacterium A37T11]|nr:Thioredoxin-like [bacterium A37T11]